MKTIMTVNDYSKESRSIVCSVAQLALAPGSEMFKAALLSTVDDCLLNVKDASTRLNEESEGHNLKWAFFPFNKKDIPSSKRLPQMANFKRNYDSTMHSRFWKIFGTRNTKQIAFNTSVPLLVLSETGNN